MTGIVWCDSTCIYVNDFVGLKGNDFLLRGIKKLHVIWVAHLIQTSYFNRSIGFVNFRQVQESGGERLKGNCII